MRKRHPLNHLKSQMLLFTFENDHLDDEQNSSHANCPENMWITVWHKFVYTPTRYLNKANHSLFYLTWFASHPYSISKVAGTWTMEDFKCLNNYHWTYVFFCITLYFTFFLFDLFSFRHLISSILELILAHIREDAVVVDSLYWLGWGLHSHVFLRYTFKLSCPGWSATQAHICCIKEQQHCHIFKMILAHGNPTQTW